MSASPKFDPTLSDLRRALRSRCRLAVRCSSSSCSFQEALRLRPGRHFGRANGHQVDVRAGSVPRRGRDKLGYVGRSSWRARGRRTRGQHRPQAHRADRRRAVHPGRRGSSLCPCNHGSCGGAPHHRRWRRSRGGGGAALCGRTGARFVARPLCVILSARHHDRHFFRLSRRWLAVLE